MTTGSALRHIVLGWLLKKILLIRVWSGCTLIYRLPTVRTEFRSIYYRLATISTEFHSNIS